MNDELTADAIRWRGSDGVAQRPIEDRDDRAVEREYTRERARREARRRLDAEARGATPEPEILTLRERLQRPRVPTQWRIDFWQPCNTRVILAAQHKTGKTTLVGGLIRSLVDGDSWLGQGHVRPVEGSVALLDTEMAASQLDDWLHAGRIRHDDRVIVVPLRGRVVALDLLDPDVRQRWAKWLRDRGVRYLIVDCLRPILDAFGLDESHDAGRVLVALDALMNEADVPEACIVHHMGHVGERSRGDSRLRDWPDVEWKLVRKDDDPASQRYMQAYGRDVDIPESQILYDAQSRRLTVASGSRHDAKAREALDDIVALLATTEPLSGRAIKHALADSNHVRAALEKALELGVRTCALVHAVGPRRAQLYRLGASVPVSRSVPLVSQNTASECPAASIEAGHSHTQMSDRVSRRTEGDDAAIF